ncbi:MAG: glycosyltransferase family 4 protein [Candidatus Lokiarchaeota archaeon]|nr:glycosyltransferase family 4 protein [Candidatus Lokiarchaeota archaeon]
MNRERIIYLTFDFLQPIFSGNGTLSRIQVFGLLEKGFNIMVLCPTNTLFGYDSDNEVLHWIDLGLLTVITIPIETKKNLGPSCDWDGFQKEAIKQLNQLQNFNPNLIVAIDWHTFDLAIFLKEKLNIQLISQFFRIFSFYEEYFLSFDDYEKIQKKELRIINYSNLIITLSRFDLEWCLAHSAKKVQTLYPPLTKSFIQLLNEIEINENQVESEEIRLITISRIVPEKKILRILPILNELKKRCVNFSYTLIGESLDKHYYQELIQSIDGYKLNRYIRILGRTSLEQMIHHLKKSSIYLHTSSYEPFGITIIEAAAANCAIFLDKDGFIGAKEVLESILHFDKLELINYSDFETTCNLIYNFYKTVKLSTKKKKDFCFISKLNPKHYIDTLVNLFMDFL